MASMMAFLPMALQVGGTLLNFSGSQQSAEAAKAAAQRTSQAKQYEAAQMDVQAGQEVAASQRGALEQKRMADLAASRALALAAASGGGTDAGVANIIASITGEGAYRSLVSLYQGESKARTLKMAADAKRYEAGVAIEEGSQKADAYQTAGLASLASGAGTLYAKYGRGGPAAQTGDSALLSPGSYDSGFEGI